MYLECRDLIKLSYFSLSRKSPALYFYVFGKKINNYRKQKYFNFTDNDVFASVMRICVIFITNLSLCVLLLTSESNSSTISIQQLNEWVLDSDARSRDKTLFTLTTEKLLSRYNRLFILRKEDYIVESYSILIIYNEM